MELKYKIETLNQLISRILNKDDKSKNDDLWLCFQVWIHQRHAKIINGKLEINLDGFETMPRPESISRIRRMIQNDKENPKFQADEETQIRREKNFQESRLIWSGGKLNAF